MSYLSRRCREIREEEARALFPKWADRSAMVFARDLRLTPYREDGTLDYARTYRGRGA